MKLHDILENKRFPAGHDSYFREIVDQTWFTFLDFASGLKKLGFDVRRFPERRGRFEQSGPMHGTYTIYADREGDHEETLQTIISLISDLVKQQPTQYGIEKWKWVNMPDDDHDTLLLFQSMNTTPNGPREIIPNRYYIRWYLTGMDGSANKLYSGN